MTEVSTVEETFVQYFFKNPRKNNQSYNLIYNYNSPLERATSRGHEAVFILSVA